MLYLAAFNALRCFCSKNNIMYFFCSPEYTAEEEEAELYNDAVDYADQSSGSSDSLLKNKKPPPPVPSEYLQPNVNGSNGELKMIKLS